MTTNRTLHTIDPKPDAPIRAVRLKNIAENALAASYGGGRDYIISALNPSVLEPARSLPAFATPEDEEKAETEAALRKQATDLLGKAVPDLADLLQDLERRYDIHGRRLM